MVRRVRMSEPLNRTYEILTQQNERWQRRNLSRIMALAVLLLALASLGIDSFGQTPTPPDYSDSDASKTPTATKAAKPLTIDELKARAKAMKAGDLFMGWD